MVCNLLTSHFAVIFDALVQITRTIFIMKNDKLKPTCLSRVDLLKEFGELRNALVMRTSWMPISEVLYSHMDSRCAPKQGMHDYYCLQPVQLWLASTDLKGTAQRTFSPPNSYQICD